MPSSPLRFVLPLVAAALLVSRPSPAQQCTEEPCGLPDATAPTVSISPGTSSVPGPNLEVTISWSDDVGLIHDPVQITYGGVDLRADFTYSKSNEWTATSSGSIAVRSGSHDLVASICDLSNNCGSATVTYTGPQQAVAVTPDGGVVEAIQLSAVTLPFTIRNTGLVETTFALTVECSWDGGCAPATSSVTLQPDQAQDVNVSLTAPMSGYYGTVRLVASAGSVEDDGTYTVSAVEAPSSDCQSPADPGDPALPICNFPPSVSISPGSADVSQPMIPVTVTGADHFEYADTTTFRIYVDGVDVTGTWERTSWDSNEPNMGPMWNVRATGVVTLSETDLTRTVKVVFCDAHPDVPECSEQIAVYRLALPGVEVTPDGTMAVLETAATRKRSFTVINRGTVEASFTLTPRCVDAESGGALSPCVASVAEANLAAGASQAVTVEHPANQVGRMLAIWLSAEQVGAPGVRDAGWSSVTVMSGVGSATPPPQVALVDLNSTAAIERSQCVTVAVSPGAAYECGDLRVAHGLPAHRTKGRTWAPVLLYSSAHADPRPTVYADVTLPAGAVVPTTVEAVVTIGAVAHRRTFAGSGWHPGTARRIAVQWFGTDMPTGVYPYSLQVISHYDGNPQASYVLSGELAVVNRSGSALGGGWWIAGDERLRCIDCSSGGSRQLWEGGDGSTRILEPEVPGQWTTWTAKRPDGPPDVVTATMVEGERRFTRKLRGGGEIIYDHSGRQILTRNRLDEETVFQRDPVTGRLESIHAPHPGTGLGPRWTFQYDAAGEVTSITAEGPGMPPRAVVLGRGGANRLASVTEPDGKQVRFDYLMTSEKRRMSSRYGRDSTRTRFEWNRAGKLGKVQTYMQGTGADVVTGFLAGEAHGVAWREDSIFSSVLRMGTYTRIDGPRTDVVDHTYLWLGARGAPVRIRDAAGGETRITRQDPHFSALATAVVGPSGLRSEVMYDTLGRVDSMVVVNPLGDGMNALTVYEWDDLWHKPTRVRSLSYDPVAKAGTPLVADVTMGYDPATGNTVWQQQLDSQRRVHFRYYDSGSAAGQLRAVQAPLDADGRAAVDSVWYDAMGNLAGTRSAGGILTLHRRDALGRDTLVITPTRADMATTEAGLLASGVRQRVEYEASADRVWRSTRIGPRLDHASPGGIVPLSSEGDTLIVETAFDGEGRPETVIRRAVPDTARVHVLMTSYGYDRAGRKTSESDGFATTQYGYDPAGNATSHTTARGHVIRTTYDAMGRMVRRVVPGVTYPHACPSQTYPCDAPYPHFPNAADGGLTIPEEWSYFRYDAAGNLVHAENAAAIVEREYDWTGALRRESQRIMEGGGITFWQDTYEFRYDYDISGRLTRLVHPEALAGAAQRDTFAYDWATGALWWAQDRRGHTFTFLNDLTGHLIRTELPGALVDTVGYDVEGRPRTRQVRGAHLAGLLVDETMDYDGRGKLMLAQVAPTLDRGGSSSYRQWYSGSGMLIATDWENYYDAARSQEAFGMDALGNTAWRRTGDGGVTYDDIVDRYRYQAGMARLELIDKVDLGTGSGSEFYGERTTREYDFRGNADWALKERSGDIDGTGMVGTMQHVLSRSYYSAEDRLRYFQENDVSIENQIAKYRGVWEEYRYDALGRRVMTDTRRRGLCDQDSWVCASATARFVWSGDQLLWELKTPSASPQEVAGHSDAYGTVGYFHAGGIDRPLVITKGSTSIIPHQNWRGQFSRGTYSNGQPSDCVPNRTPCTNVAWPGYRTTAWHMESKEPNIRNWFGGLVDGMRDASGQMYMRNRYYDPATGQFTQPDPIGLAGGLNAYGFAAGDPITYSDPFGLCIWLWRERCRNKTSRFTYGDLVNMVYHGSPSLLMDMMDIRDRAAMLIGDRSDSWGADEVGADKANAFRHIYGSCELTRRRGVQEARQTTRGHEEPLRRGNSEQARDSRNDTANNEIGIREGNSSSNEHLTCENIADRSVHRGGYAGRGGSSIGGNN